MSFLDRLSINLNDVLEYPSLKSVAVLGGTLAYSAVGGAGGAYCSLLFLIFTDTFLGIATAIKFHEFSFIELKKLPVKIILYWTTIACALHVDTAIISVIEDISWLEEFMKMYKACILWFCSTELVSIGRKMNRWGIAVPIKHITHAIKGMLYSHRNNKAFNTFNNGSNSSSGYKNYQNNQNYNYSDNSNYSDYSYNDEHKEYNNCNDHTEYNNRSNRSNRDMNYPKQPYRDI